MRLDIRPPTTDLESLDGPPRSSGDKARRDEHGTMNLRPKVLMVTLNDDPSGGGAYESMVAESLTGCCEINRHEMKFGKSARLKYLRAPLEFTRMFATLIRDAHCAVAIKTFDAALFSVGGPARTIVMLHHLRPSGSGLYSRLERHVFEQLRRVSAVVVVSEYWNRYLRNAGLENVRKIYNAFRPEDFVIPDAQVESFKRRCGLVGKPIIYLGTYHRWKGVDESFEALKDLDAHLIASGVPRSGYPAVKCFGRPDYLCLLKASAAVVTMSQFDEGWCRTAHEAMFCGTPVAGSGRGGMRELLERGHQFVCEDFRSLRGVVENLLAHEEKRAALGRAGYDYAKQFTYAKFQKAWIRLVDQVCAVPTAPRRST